MTFKFHGLDPARFDAWVAKVKAEGEPLDRARYLELEKPSEGEPVRYFSSVGARPLRRHPQHVHARPARCA